MLANQIDLVEMTTAHLEGALSLSQQAQWPHRREDWAMSLSLSKGVAAIHKDRVLGTAMATLYGDDVATINMVIVDEAMRGLGIGKRLMDFVLNAASGRECRLVATRDGLPLYEKLGFRETHRIVQHQGPILSIPSPAHVEWANAADTAECAELDHAACGMDRHNLIDYLAVHGRLAVIRHDAHIAAFGAIRRFGRGEVAGPIVAGNADEARHLLSFLFAGHEGRFMRVDTSEESGLAPWLTELGLAHVGGGIAMVRDGKPRENTTVKTFALASQALG
ncbi:GNAT family N-acetyltransferase [Rhizobium skierniewicense]|uniref:GNAT family N-acetyltransferase n=1 Tax=Rhizobium skierniewicense TaxID=984260 RepID=UPI0015728B8E|nr:GNAT family N-acetyltransferase [Rhizobium skierniewicense]NTF34005.1 GNAT family N-acetyltransferase [Rhizobium skierniewicense]